MIHGSIQVVAGGALSLCLSLACGRIGFEPTTLAEDAAPTTDASSTDHIRVADSWDATIWRDFSSIIEYEAEDYLDGDEIYSNAPSVLLELSAPFEAGIGVMAGRQIIELSADGTTTPHDYRPPMVNTATLPDAMSDAVQIATWRGSGESILVSSSSDMSGDGVFQIAPDWSMTRVDSHNNVRGVAFDTTGDFDGVGAPEVYWGAHFGLWRFADPMPEKLANGDVLSLAFQTASTILAVRRVPNELRVEVLTVDSGTHTETQLSVHDGNQMPLVRGSVSTEGATFVRNRSELVEISNLPAEVTIASSDDPDWIWMSAIRVSEGPLAFDGYYLLERNPVLDVERVLQIHAP